MPTLLITLCFFVFLKIILVRFCAQISAPENSGGPPCITTSPPSAMRGRPAQLKGATAGETTPPTTEKVVDAAVPQTPTVSSSIVRIAENAAGVITQGVDTSSPAPTRAPTTEKNCHRRRERVDVNSKMSENL